MGNSVAKLLKKTSVAIFDATTAEGEIATKTLSQKYASKIHIVAGVPDTTTDVSKRLKKLAGVYVLRVDMNNPVDVERMVKGMDTILVQVHNIDEDKDKITKIMDTAATSGVKFAVVLTDFLVNQEKDLEALELVLSGRGDMKWIIVRRPLVLEHLVVSELHLCYRDELLGCLSDGEMIYPLPLDDIGLALATILENPQNMQQRIIINGPPITPATLTQAFQTSLSRPSIEYVQIGSDEWLSHAKASSKYLNPEIWLDEFEKVQQRESTLHSTIDFQSLTGSLPTQVNTWITNRADLFHAPPAEVVVFGESALGQQIIMRLKNQFGQSYQVRTVAHSEKPRDSVNEDQIFQNLRDQKELEKLLKSVHVVLIIPSAFEFELNAMSMIENILSAAGQSQVRQILLLSAICSADYWLELGSRYDKLEQMAANRVLDRETSLCVVRLPLLMDDLLPFVTGDTNHRVLTLPFLPSSLILVSMHNAVDAIARIIFQFPLHGRSTINLVGNTIQASKSRQQSENKVAQKAPSKDTQRRGSRDLEEEPKSQEHEMDMEIDECTITQAEQLAENSSQMLWNGSDILQFLRWYCNNDSSKQMALDPSILDDLKFFLKGSSIDSWQSFLESSEK